MNKSDKIWKKCIEKYKSIDYNYTPPLIKEGIKSVSIADHKSGDLITEYFNDENQLAEKWITRDKECEYIKYNPDGTLNNISRTVYTKNEREDKIEENITGIVEKVDEKLEYDKKGRVIRKYLKYDNKKSEYLEFEYDEANSTAITRIYTNGILIATQKEIKKEKYTEELKYDGYGKLIVRCEDKTDPEKRMHFQNQYYHNGELKARNEEDLDEFGEVKEQRFYNGKEQLIRQINFSNKDGCRKCVKDFKYENKVLKNEIVYTYDYDLIEGDTAPGIPKS